MLKFISKISTLFALLLVFNASAYAAKVSAYFTAPYKSADSVKSNLAKSGFSVLSTYSPASKSHLKVIVFTNKKLKSLASSPTRGFASILRVMVDSKNKQVKVTNPKYWLNAFMQSKYTPSMSSDIQNSLEKTFGKLTPTKDVLDENKLSHYHFMMAMPYYEDMIEIPSTTVQKKNKLFELKLNNGSKLIGVKLSKKTESFINTIGNKNAILLPYTVLVENGKTYALHGKFYLALSYPLLSMGQFMKIATTPGEIEDDLTNACK
jgi:hypothetical protein